MSSRKIRWDHLPSGIDFRRGWQADSKEWRWRCECGAKTDTDSPWHLGKQEQYRDAMRHHFFQHWPTTWQLRVDPGGGIPPLRRLGDRLDHLFELP